jgi:hypothetical protein
MNNDRWEFTDADAATLGAFMRQLLRSETHDHVAPLGPLRACVDDPAVDADNLRQALAGELWDACELDKAPEWQQETEVQQWNKLGSSSLCDRYDLRGSDGTLSAEEKFEKFFLPRTTRVNSRALELAAEKVMKLLLPSTGRGLRSWSLEDAVAITKDDTSFGYPKCNSDPANVYYYYLEADRIKERGYPLADASLYPCVGTTRTQSSGYRRMPKRRVLMMYCKSLVYLENMTRKPAFDAFRTLPEFVAWNGQKAVDAAITRLLDRNPGEILSADFTDFDVSVPFQVLNWAFKVLAACFVSGDQDLIRFTAEAFMRTGVFLPATPRCPEGIRWGEERTGGVPSGSGNTNLIDTIVNMIVFHYGAIVTGGSVEQIFANGDDAVVVLKGTNAASVSEVLGEQLGMIIKMDPSKNLVSKNHVKFLQMDHHSTVRDVRGLHCGIRPVERALIKMTGHERRLARKHLGTRDASPVRWSGAFNTFRWIQQLEPCSTHQGFEGAVSWYVGHDRFVGDIIEAIRCGDRIVDDACAYLSGEDGGEVSVKSFRNSVVVAKACELFGVPSPCATS